MSEDNQWRQLGSIVNGVLMDTRTKAIRRGMQSKLPRAPIEAKTQQILPPAKKLGHGFLNPDYGATAEKQLELPFGFSDFDKPSAKGLRLM